MAGAPAMASVNLIDNGGFCLDCQTDGWAVSLDQGAVMRVRDAGDGEGFLSISGASATFSQTLRNVNGPLTLSFDYRLEQSSRGQSLAASYNGNIVFLTSTMSNGWAHVQLAVTGHGLDTLRFAFSILGPLSSGAMSLDNVVLAAVPEPHTYAMLFAGLTLLGVAARRRPI